MQNLCQSRKAFLWRCAHVCVYIYICVCICTFKSESFLGKSVKHPQESVTWVYSSFHRWCKNAWEDGRITNLCNLFSKKYSRKQRLLSRTWLNISKLEHTVLILRPSMFIAAVVKRLVPASLNAWRHRTAIVQKGANRWKWPKPKKNFGQKNKKHTIFRESWLGPPLPKSLEIFLRFFSKFLPLFRESWLGHPPSKESRLFIFCCVFFWCFSKVFTKCGVLQGNRHES